jgi:WD40 repeat protein
VNFDGPVRVPETAGSGSALATVSFDAWNGAKVASTTHSIAVLPARPGSKEEPIAASRIASLVHPERKANFWTVRFSPDGRKLFGAGYPSGIIQIWDVASRKEIWRVDTPPGGRGSANYALLTPDWKTMYVPVWRRTVKAVERNGKKTQQFTCSGEVRVWDVAAGKERPPLPSAVGAGPQSAYLSPDGQHLLSIESASFELPENPRYFTEIWDLGACKKWKLTDEIFYASFLRDGRGILGDKNDYRAGTSVLKLLDLRTGKELATLNSPEKGRFFSVGDVSPDGSLAAVGYGSVGRTAKKGPPPEFWFLDTRTLEVRGKLICREDPERSGFRTGKFSPDGKRFVAVDHGGHALVWNVANRTLERSIHFREEGRTWQLTFSPGARTLALGWMPKADAELEDALDPDPQDLPQPRVTLLDLEGKSPTRVLVAPHGYVGGVAFAPDGKTLAFGGAGAVHLFDLMR